MPDTQTSLQAELLRKATSIGPARMGDRYMMPKNPSLFDMFKQMMGGERPKSVVEQDPTGGLTYLAGKGPAPGLVMGSTEEVSPLAKQLYSRLTRAFESAPEAMHPNKAASIAKSAAPAEEAQWRKLPEMLASKGNQPVKKAEILSHLEQNPIKLKETVLGEQEGEALRLWNAETRMYGPEFQRGTVHEQTARALAESNPQVYHVTKTKHFPQPTKYSQHTLPGGENYRENLVQLDTTPRLDILEQKLKREGKLVGPEVDEYNRLVSQESLPKTSGTAFTQGHFEQPNVLVHTRTKDRQLLSPKDVPSKTTYLKDGAISGVTAPVSKGPKGTFIEELQSDWHQKGKEQGYQSAELNARNKTRLAEIKPKIDQLYKETERIAGEQYALERQYNEAQGYRGPAWFAEGNTDANPAPTPFMRDSELHGSDDTANPVFKQYQYLQKEYERLTSERDALNAEARVLAQDRHNGVPDAPFKESWPDLGLKRELLGVANDPEKSWLGWTTGADQAKRYDLSKQISKVVYNPQTHTLEAFGLDGNQVMGNIVPPEELPDHIGKEAARKLLSTDPVPYKGTDPGWGSGEGPVHSLEGLDLQVGGEGMKEFYDKLLPARMNKILKPFGGQVEKGELPTGRANKPEAIKFVPGTDYGNVAKQQADQTYNIAGITDNMDVASTFPRVASSGLGAESQEKELINLLTSQDQRLHPERHGPETFQAWIAKLTPEMKQRIQKEGLPLLTSLYLVWQHSQKPVETKQ